jgi:hypothetical protein
MNTITLKDIKPKASFLTVASHAAHFAKQSHCLVRFAMGPKGRRQTFVASPKKPVATLVWEWARSPGGQAVKRVQRKVAKVIVETGAMPA